MSKLFTTRRRIAIVVGASAVVLAGGGAAFAYFTASGSGTGSATVGATGTWAVSPGQLHWHHLPGLRDRSVITFNVKNTGTADQQYSTATAAVNSSGGDITQSGSPVSGCLATWFSTSVSSDPGINTNVGGGDTVQVQVTVTMPTDSTDNQNDCQSATPDVTLTIG